MNPVFIPDTGDFDGFARDLAGKVGVRQPGVLGKCLLALELTGCLAQTDLPFVFKGGTSLVILLNPVRRLSVDVDILCREPKEALERALDEVVAEHPLFISWVHQVYRDREAPPTRHYKIHVNSRIDGSPDPNIQLDVIHSQEEVHARITETPLGIPDWGIESQVTVATPSLSSLFADKMATFAPTTIGYPYQPITRTGQLGEPRPIKLVKHLYDVGFLAEVADDNEEIMKTYENIFAEQCRYRGLSCGMRDALEDTLHTSFLAARLHSRKDGTRNLAIPTAPTSQNDDEKSLFLRAGCRSLESHLFEDLFGWDKVRIAAGRAALGAAFIRARHNGNLAEMIKKANTPGAEMAGARLDDPYTDLNMLKTTDPVAFALWLQAAKLLTT